MWITLKRWIKLTLILINNNKLASSTRFEEVLLIADNYLFHSFLEFPLFLHKYVHSWEQNMRKRRDSKSIFYWIQFAVANYVSANREARRGGLIERVDRRKKRLEKRRRTEKEIEKERERKERRGRKGWERVHVGEQTESAIASFPTSFPGVTRAGGRGGVLITSRFWARGWVAPRKPPPCDATGCTTGG